MTVVVLVVLLVAVGVVIKHGRYYVLAKRFAVVQEGRLYRSGYLHAWPLKRMLSRHDIRTVLCLMHEVPGGAELAREKAILDERGVEFINIGMPGDGCADFDLLDEAADIIADESKRPLLAHCNAGKMRSSAVYAAWRMRHCGWDIDQALAETARYGVTPQEEPELCEHLRRYYETRVVSPASSAASSE